MIYDADAGAESQPYRARQETEQYVIILAGVYLRKKPLWNLNASNLLDIDTRKELNYTVLETFFLSREQWRDLK